MGSLFDGAHHLADGRRARGSGKSMLSTPLPNDCTWTKFSIKRRARPGRSCRARKGERSAAQERSALRRYGGRIEKMQRIRKHRLGRRSLRLSSLRAQEAPGAAGPPQAVTYEQFLGRLCHTTISHEGASDDPCSRKGKLDHWSYLLKHRARGSG